MRRSALFAIAGAVAFGACPVHAQDPAAQSGAGSAAPEPVPPLLVPRTVESRATREAVLRRDPFRPFALAREQAKQPGKGSPLQQYQVGQLRLVGVIEDGSPTAIVEDDQRNGYVIGLGTEIGPNGGVVTAIRGRQVTVVEWETDIVGERHRKEYVLQMPADEPVRQQGPRG